MKETDPFFCLAAEEFFLKNYREDLFIVWQSHNAVVVGKHQNALAEINYRFVRENGIKVARRISGGGTVFHDRGNVNFSFIRNVQGPQEVNFRLFMEPIREVLAGIGVNAAFSGRNDLLAGRKKISGNAQHLFKNRVLHHGTLLFDADLNHLAGALSAGLGKYTGKAVESRHSEVVNISEFLKNPLSREEFMEILLNYQLKTLVHARNFSIPPSDKKNITILSRGKFETPEWQYGYSPSYVFSNTAVVENRQFSVILDVEKGIIKKAVLSGNFYRDTVAKSLETLLTGKYHLYENVFSAHQTLGTEADEEVIFLYF